MVCKAVQKNWFQFKNKTKREEISERKKRGGCF